MRKRPRREPCPEVYQLKVEGLKELESLCEQGLIDLYYGDESRLCLEPCVPYAWQFKDEEVFMPSGKGPGLNCFALLSRTNQCHFATTQERVDTAFIVEQLDKLSLSLERTSVLVLDNAPVHTAKVLRERRAYWQERGLFLFYLPPYSPHLNLAEVLWRKLKYEWLKPEDYFHAETLFYQVRQALAAVGTLLKINFAPFQLGLT